MKTFVVLIFLILIKSVSGQVPSELFIPAGATVSEVLTPEKIYQNPHFVIGNVLYTNGTETEALLNYNYLSGEVQFIGPNKDTMVIAKEQLANIKKIMINGHTYVYHQAYFEQVEENAVGRLLKRQIYLVANKEKIGAYNQTTSVSAIASFSNLTDRTGGVSRSLKVNENTTLALRSEFFFADEKNNVLPATKKNLIKVYTSNRLQLEDYLKKNKVDFNNLEDLKKLFSSL